MLRLSLLGLPGQKPVAERAEGRGRFSPGWPPRHTSQLITCSGLVWRWLLAQSPAQRLHSKPAGPWPNTCAVNGLRLAALLALLGRGEGSSSPRALKRPCKSSSKAMCSPPAGALAALGGGAVPRRGTKGKD